MQILENFANFYAIVRNLTLFMLILGKLKVNLQNFKHLNLFSHKFLQNFNILHNFENYDFLSQILLSSFDFKSILQNFNQIFR